MSRPWRAASRWSTLTLSLVLAACASGPRSTDSERQEYLTARDGALEFLLPNGWFNASNDARTPDETIWLVSGDYTATISVREVTMDEDARRILRRDGMLRLAQVTIGLNPEAVITRGPAMIRHGGREYCSYDVRVAPENDAVRVALVDTGEQVFEVRTLVSGQGSTAGAFAAQEEFLKGLRW
jgi:hypothetical protein